MNASVIENVPLFGVLSERQRTLIGERLVLEKHPAGTPLFTQGEPGDKLFLVKTGWVRLVSDQMAVLANLSQGSLLGDADVMLGHNHNTTAEAVVDVDAWSLGLEDLVDIVSQDPEIGLKLSGVYRASIVPLIRYLVERRLRGIPGLDELPDNVLITVAGRLCVHDAKAGELLFSAGQAPSSLFIVEEGRVTAGGPADPLGEYGPGELVAERNLLLGRAHTFTARAGAASRLWELSVSDLERLCGLYPDLRAALGRTLQSRLEAFDIARAVSLLRATPIFQALPSAALNELAAKMVVQNAPSGAHICEADTPAEAMYLVEGGSVELLSRHGESQGSIQAGAYFGEAGLRGGVAYGFAAVARGSTTLWVLSHADFLAVAQRHPAVQTALEDQLRNEREEAAEHFAEKHLRRLSLFANMRPEQLRDIAGYLRPERFRAGQVIYQRGQAGEALYLIEQGRISVQTRTTDGGTRVLAIMGPGDFVGETALLTGEPHATDTFAQNEVEAWALTRQDFETLLNEYPVLGVNLSRALSYRLRQSNEQAGAGLAAAAPVAYEPESEAAAATGPVEAPIRSPLRAPRAARPIPVVQPTRPAAEQRTGLAPLAFLDSLSTGAKVRLVVIAVLVIWLIFIVPFFVITRLSTASPRQAQSGKTSLLERSVLVAMAAGNEETQDAAGPTWTPWPTETPIPSPTPTATQIPTATQVPPTATVAPPTATAVPPTATQAPRAATAEPVQVAQVAAAPAAAAAVKAAAAAPARPANRYTLKEVRHMTPCENKGKHNIFIQVVDAAGAPVDGVTVAETSVAMDQVFDMKVTGDKGPGKAEFDMYKNGRYKVYITENRQGPTSTEITPPLGSVRDMNDNPWPDELCAEGGGNTTGHNSFNVIYIKNW